MQIKRTNSVCLVITDTLLNDYFPAIFQKEKKIIIIVINVVLGGLVGRTDSVCLVITVTITASEEGQIKKLSWTRKNQCTHSSSVPRLDNIQKNLLDFFFVVQFFLSGPTFFLKLFNGNGRTEWRTEGNPISPFRNFVATGDNNKNWRIQILFCGQWGEVTLQTEYQSFFALGKRGPVEAG